jgi:hypothetical protein
MSDQRKTTTFLCRSIIALCLFLQQTARVSAWSPRIAPTTSTTPSNNPALSKQRRSLFVTASALLVTSAVVLLPLSLEAQAAATTPGAEVRGTKLTPLNGLAFQYRGTDYGGLAAAEINEPSISYADFMVKLKAGEVELVEFLAPDGDTAYATFKAKAGVGTGAGTGAGKESPIRIGEGYPVEQHDGWSSPAFAVRAVQNAGVTYKFTVPALQAYKNGR